MVVAAKKERLRARLRVAVRDSILEAAERSIVEEGLEGASLLSIARRAGVAVGTIYNYFHDRQELFRELFGTRKAELVTALDHGMKDVSGEPFDAQLETFARIFFATYDARREFMRVVMGSEPLRLQMMCDRAGRLRSVIQELQTRAERVMRVRLHGHDARGRARPPRSESPARRRRSARRRALLQRSHSSRTIMSTVKQLSKAEAPEAAAEVPAAPAAESAQKRGSRAYLVLGAIVLVGLAAYLVFRAVTAGKESTDDAQVASDMVPIAARVAGDVVELAVRDNQAVKKGDLIARIDPTDYESREKQAEAELAAAQAQADSADAQVKIVSSSSKGGLTSAKAALSGSAATAAGAEAQIAAAQAALARAQSEAQKADTDLRRAQQLRKDDAIPQAQVDTYQATASAAHSAVAQAQAQLASAQEARSSAQSRIAEAQGRVEQSTPVAAQLEVAKANASLAHARADSAKAVLALAKQQLAYTRIVAPCDGHVSKLDVHTGQLVSPGQVVTSVLPTATYLIANFKETQVGDMRPGQSATVSIDAFPGREFHAKVDSVSYGTGAAFSLLPPDNASGNFVKVVQRVPVKLVWAEAPGDIELQAGLSVDVTVRTK
jgi:membrane fusion protein (multidrug efflux system)